MKYELSKKIQRAIKTYEADQIDLQFFITCSSIAVFSIKKTTIGKHWGECVEENNNSKKLLGNSMVGFISN